MCCTRVTCLAWATRAAARVFDTIRRQQYTSAALQGGAAPPAGVVQIQLLGGGRAAARTAYNQDFIALLKCAALLACRA